MEYRVILVANGKYKKTLHQCKTRETAFSNYNRIKDANKVFYPKEFINSKKIKSIKYQICITKITEDGDTKRTLRDEYGKLYTEKLLGDWTILVSDDYLIEERFWLYGNDSRLKRPTISEILKKLMAGAHAKNAVKQIIVVHNKVLMYNENYFDMVICKNMGDAQRLHHTLSKIARKQKIKSLLFIGTASKTMISRMYDLIKEKTGWKIRKINRTSTRP